MATQPDTDTTETKVIFRKWRDGSRSVFALFPEMPHDWRGYDCGSYEHVGQHGGADGAGCVRRSTPATPEEYADLKRELERIGYRLRVVSRIPRNALATRRAEIAAQDARANARA